MPNLDFFDKDGPQDAAPSISAEYASYIRETAAKIERDNPGDPQMLEHAARLRADIQGLAPQIPTDPRSPQQRLHDQRFGVTFAADGKPALPNELAGVIQRDAAAVVPDPKTVAAQLAGAGMDYERLCATAQALLHRIGSAAKAENLSASSLSQLSVYAAHLKKHADSRPKS
jgi:hypothetical protein